MSTQVKYKQSKRHKSVDKFVGKYIDIINDEIEKVGIFEIKCSEIYVKKNMLLDKLSEMGLICSLKDKLCNHKCGKNCGVYCSHNYWTHEDCNKGEWLIVSDNAL